MFRKCISYVYYLSVNFVLSGQFSEEITNVYCIETMITNTLLMFMGHFELFFIIQHASNQVRQQTEIITWFEANLTYEDNEYNSLKKSENTTATLDTF